MDFQIAAAEKECPRMQLAAYVEGELLPREEFELEIHLANCKDCAAELNEQKKMLFALDCALDNEKEIELPANFTKVVVTNAESKVSGLRSSRERFKAFSVCSGLIFLTLCGLGAKTGTTLNTFVKFAGQVFAVGGFALHLIYDFSVGAAVILRSLSNQFVGSSPFAAIFLFAFTAVSLLALSRLIVRNNRAKKIFVN